MTYSWPFPYNLEIIPSTVEQWLGIGRELRISEQLPTPLVVSFQFRVVLIKEFPNHDEHLKRERERERSWKR